MIRVTKAEVKEALGERLMTKEYCICRSCHYAFRITDEERKEYQDLRCGNCSTKDFYYAGYDVGLVDSIIDPEPTQPQEQYRVFVKGHNLSVSFDTLDVANSEADWRAALPDNIGKKVLVLKVINTRIATSKIEYERS